MEFSRISWFVPRKIVQAFTREMRYNHIAMDEGRFIGLLIIASFGVGLVLGALGSFVVGVHPLIGFFVGAIATFAITYLFLHLSSESKGKFVESILPDALQLIASNMKSGLTTERSLFVAGRPEFGPLQFELMNASKRISSGERVDVALQGIGDGINSPVLQKTLWLISRGMRSGGQIADLLFQLSDDLKEQQALEEETRSNISIYVLLILFSAIFGAPMLFGISSFIVQVLSKQLSEVPTIDPAKIPAGGNLGPIKAFASGEKSRISPDFVLLFSMTALTITTLFSCLTIGVITSGKEINGLRYVLPLLIVAFVAFFAIRFALIAFFGTLV